MLNVPDIINEIFEQWADSIEEYVGDNVYMENSVTVSSFPAATMYFMGLPTDISDLSGAEAGVSPTLQIDIYTNGQKALSKAYEIDEKSHETMLGFGFHRSYGPELIQATDPDIKRLTSRYTRLIGFDETL